MIEDLLILIVVVAAYMGTGCLTAIAFYSYELRGISIEDARKIKFDDVYLLIGLLRPVAWVFGIYVGLVAACKPITNKIFNLLYKLANIGVKLENDTTENNVSVRDSSDADAANVRLEKYKFEDGAAGDSLGVVLNDLGFEGMLSLYYDMCEYIVTDLDAVEHEHLKPLQHDIQHVLTDLQGLIKEG